MGGGGAKVRNLKLVDERKMALGRDVNGFKHPQTAADGQTFTHHAADGPVLHRSTKHVGGTVAV